MLTLAERLSRKLTKGADSECWLWHGNRIRKGYGTISFRTKEAPSGTKTVYTHRVAYELACGPIPDGMMVCHRCDNPPCCNPSHLFLADAAGNNRDMAEKERNFRQTPEGRAYTSIHKRGIAHHGAKLDDDRVRQIRASDERPTMLAAKFGVGASTICAIRKRKTWRHVSEGHPQARA